MICITDFQERKVVTCFLESGGRILLLRRSEQVSIYQGRWAGISGFIDKYPEVQALVEIDEETGLHGKGDLEFIAKSEPIAVEDEILGIRWLVYPYLFHVHDRRKIKLDREHQEARWISPRDIGDYQTVPMLKEALESVYRLSKRAF